MRSRTATSPPYITVHCRYCINLAGLSKSKLSFICCTKCKQEENKVKWRSFAVLSVFLATAILFGPFSHGSKIHISPRPRTSHASRVDSVFITVYLGVWGGWEGGGQKNCLILPPTFALPSQTGCPLLKYDVPVKLKLQHPPGQPPGHLNF